MLIPGPIETFQIVDRSVDLPVMQHLAVTEDVIAFAAPALAAVGDAYAGEAEAERFRLNSRLDELLRDCAGITAPGLGNAAPYYSMLPFSQGAVHSFAKIRQVLGEDDIFSTQTYAIAHSEDAPLLLIRTAVAQARIETLHNVGIDIHASWINIPTGSA